MKCLKCEKELRHGSDVIITINEEKVACMPCFFKGIPETTSRMDADFEEKKAQRDKAIQERILEWSKK